MRLFIHVALIICLALYVGQFGFVLFCDLQRERFSRVAVLTLLTASSHFFAASSAR